MRLVLRIIACGTLALAARAQVVWHVDASAPAGGNGASWTSAFTTLGAALAVAQRGDEIWVADGTYLPPPSASADPRETAFYVPRDLKLYGGFAGGETSVAARAGLFATTVLSGDLGVLGSDADNAHHVIRTWCEVTIDGFRIERGNAVGAGLVYYPPGSEIQVSAEGALARVVVRVADLRALAATLAPDLELGPGTGMRHVVRS